MTVRELMAIVEELAPAALAEEWDNPGLLTGDPAQTVTGILLCVDVTPAVLDQAAALGANVILSHHPLMFGGTKTLRADRYEGALLTRLIREDRALIAAHTNLDRAPGGVNDCLAAALGIAVDARGEDVRAGAVQARTAGELLRTVRALNPQAVFYGEEEAPIRRAACACGAGGCFYREAAAMGAQVFVTGEIKHHERLEAQGMGMAVIIAGHAESEAVVLEPLRADLAARTCVPVWRQA